jgi:hypothetical protein
MKEFNPTPARRTPTLGVQRIDMSSSYQSVSQTSGIKFVFRQRHVQAQAQEIATQIAFEITVQILQITQN